MILVITQNSPLISTTSRSDLDIASGTLVISAKGWIVVLKQAHEVFMAQGATFSLDHPIPFLSINFLHKSVEKNLVASKAMTSLTEYYFFLVN